MHARKHINYADLNTGIDSEPDYSPPHKKKRDVVAALREPSQTVISAHWQCLMRQGLRRMFPSPEHKTPKLVGTVIISPPAKTLLSNKEIKQEDDWLKLPKNVPTDTRLLMDPSVKFTIKHTDGSVCRHKKTWAFYNCKPPQKDDEVPALGVKKSSKYSLHSGKASSDKDTAIIEINSCLDDTKESENQTDTEKPNSTHKESKNKHDVNTENAVTIDGADSQNVPVNTENIDETLDETFETGVTTENPIMNSQDSPVNTENIDKTLDTNDDEAVNTENYFSTDNSIDTEVQ